MWGVEKTVEELTVIGEHPLWQWNANQAMRLTTTDAYYSVGEKRLEKYFHLFQVFLSFKWGFQIQSATFTPLKNGREIFEQYTLTQGNSRYILLQKPSEHLEHQSQAKGNQLFHILIFIALFDSLWAWL